MTNALATTQNGNTDIITFDDDKVGLIKRTIAKDATDDELALFLHQAQRTGLDPLARQIYFQKYNTRNGPQIAIITGIDGYRLVAVRTGLYAGNDAPEFEGRINYQGNDVPAKASVTVYRIVGNRRCAFTASVYWNEYCPAPPKDYQWKKMPHVMLAKCAEAAALRKAFPADLSGVYTQEEMGQAEWFDDIELEVKRPSTKVAIAVASPMPDADLDFVLGTTPPSRSLNIPEVVAPSEIPMTGRDDYEQHVAHEAPSTIADVRASLEEYPRMTGIQVANAVLSVGLYNGRDHVESTLKKHHEGFRKSGGKLSTGVERDVALEWFDFLVNHKEPEAA